MNTDMSRILANANGGVYFFRLIAPEDVAIAGEAITNLTFNANEVHHYDHYQVHDGVKEVRTKVRGESKDEHGRKRKDEREAISFQPKYREEARAVYVTPVVKNQENATKVANLAVGEYFLLCAAGLFRIQGKMLEAAWPFNLTEKRTLEAIRRIRSRSHYQPARLVVTLPPEPPPDKKKRGGAAKLPGGP
jgi:hypothetical protein